jgi:hypothetical protein
MTKMRTEVNDTKDIKRLCRVSGSIPVRRTHNWRDVEAPRRTRSM